MTRPLTAVLASVSALGPALPAAAQAPQPVVEVVIEGKGFGHGVGMAQDGAYAMGLAGASVRDILAKFYPGATLGRRSGSVRVEILDGPRPSVVVEFPSGGEVREGLSGDSSPGFPVTVSAGGRVRLSFDGRRYSATPLGGASPTAASRTTAPVPEPEAPPESTTTTTVPSLLGLIPLPPLTTTPPAPPATEPPPPPPPEAPAIPTSERALWAIPEGGSTALPDLGRRYKGTLEASAAGGGLQLVNHLDVEQYLRGMGEVLAPSWPAAALQAQAIAARTYAIQTMAAGRPLCSTQQCQVYLGETVEYAAMNRAVADTAGQVLTYGGSLAEAVYSASGGGVTATPEEGFGLTGDHPYLKATPYPTIDPQPWTVRMRLAEVASRSGYRGRASDVRVSRVGPSGRPLEIVVTGDADHHTIAGLRFAANLGLRSNFFTIRTEGAVEERAAESPATVAGQLRPGSPAKVLEAGVEAPPLGRAPWAALALLLLAAWAAAARAHAAPRRPTPSETRVVPLLTGAPSEGRVGREGTGQDSTSTAADGRPGDRRWRMSDVENRNLPGEPGTKEDEAGPSESEPEAPSVEGREVDADEE